MFGTFDPQILIGGGLVIGGIVAGVLGAIKLPMFKTTDDRLPIEKSGKTSGALHISEEALSKICTIETALKEEYLTRERHADFCAIQQGAIKLYISEVLKIHTQEILAAIKKSGNNGHGHTTMREGNGG
jgi:hypothetical protein